MKHKEIVRLINSNHDSENKAALLEKEPKEDQKRVIAKKGREAPKIEGEDDDIIEETPTPPQKVLPKKI